MTGGYLVLKLGATARHSSAEASSSMGSKRVGGQQQAGSRAQWLRDDGGGPVTGWGDSCVVAVAWRRKVMNILMFYTFNNNNNNIYIVYVCCANRLLP